MLFCRQTPCVDKITGDHRCSLQCDTELMTEYYACMTHEKNGNTAVFGLQETYALRGKFVCTILTELLYK